MQLSPADDDRFSACSAQTVCLLVGERHAEVLLLKSCKADDALLWGHACRHPA
jgi:hypothetical protein